MNFRTWIRTGALALGLIVTGTLAGGCSASKGKLTVKANEGQAVLAQSFNQAYISGSRDGEYDVLLIQDPVADQSTAASKGGKWPMRWFKRSADSAPLQPTEAAQLRQVVHIHVFWQSDNNQAAKDGVVTNAAIDWYVIAHESSDRAEVLRYQGAGHVTLDPGRNDTTAVRVNNGSMKQAEVRGGLQDPFGPASLAGTVTARRNSQLVRDTLADLKAQTLNPTGTALSEAR